MKRLVLAASAFTLAGCMITPNTPPPAKAEPKQTREKQVIHNQSYFDLAACEMKQPAIPEQVTSEVLPGLIRAAQPHVHECLVEPKNRGAEKASKVVVNSTLGESGVEHTVSGENLTPEGQACVLATLQKWTQVIPGAKAGPNGPVTAQVEFQHSTDNQPAVTFGMNEASDIVGLLRLATASSCECFVPWKDTVPQPLKVSVTVANPLMGQPPPPPKKEGEEGEEVPAPPERVNPSKIVFEPSEDPTTQQVAACLHDKIMQQQFKTPVGDLTLSSMPLFFVNSNVSKPLENGIPDFQFLQLNLVRNRVLAEVDVAVGARTQVQGAYDTAIEKYMRKRKPGAAMKRDLQSKWAALVAADQRVIERLQSHLAVEELLHQFMAAQKETDPAWAEAEAAAVQRVEATKKDLENWTAALKADEASRIK